MKNAPLFALALAAGSAFAWTEAPHATIDGDRLVVDVPAGETRSSMVSREVDLAPFRGAGVRISIKASATGVSTPPQPWLGFKFMLQFRDARTGKDYYPEGNQPHSGSFEEREFVLYQDFADVDATDAKLVLGLQESTGRAEYDLASLRIERAEPIFPRVNGDYRVRYPERVLSAPRARGVMLPSGNCKEDDFRTLHEWGATLARYQMVRSWGAPDTDRDLVEYDQWIGERLDHLEQVLAWARQYGLRIVVDLHSPPGGRSAGGELNCFFETVYADHFVEVWRRIATRFKGRPEIYGFDLVNEPSQHRPAPFGYWELQRRAAEAVRAIDPDTTIIVEACEWDNPGGFRYLSPLAMDNVVYQVHLYVPHAFTHQGVGGRAWTRVAWPSTQPDGTVWDREYLRKELEPVREFERRHNAKIYAGEFSAIVWADGADRYIADAISLFEEYGWDWTYHAFREWNGWSVEHEATAPQHVVPSSDNPRRRALLEGFRRP